MSEEQSSAPLFVSHTDAVFLRTLLADDDLVAVVRGHLFIEAELNLLLTKFIQGCEPLLEVIEFLDRARVARRMRVIGRPTMRSLQTIGEIRNQFAHNLERCLTAEDDKKVMSALSNGNRLFIEQYLKTAPGESRDGVVTRLGLLRVHVDLYHLARLAPFQPGTYEND